MDTHMLMSDIEEIRRHEKVSVADVCKTAGISRRTWYSWVKGESTPNLYNLGRALDALGLDLIPVFRAW